MLSLPLELKVKAVKIGNSLRMTIPLPIAEYLNIKENDMLLVSVTDSQMNVKKQKGDSQ